ncbi:hypothetical protein O3X23_26275 [Streptomyces sp. H39-S7]|nr:hypothetical protein [Streptomyces sp. H39-S7]MCZ4122855.1 hypothetical protein [Streptomyces sp. H39-S7]
MPYTITQDPMVWPTYAAECVSGDAAACGATSGERSDPADVDEWIRRHAQGAGHTSYRRSFTDFVALEPPEDLPPGTVMAFASPTL